MRRMLPLLPLLFAAAACVSAPAPEAAAPLPPLARAALEEWRSWGGIVVEGWPEARPADTAATPARFARLLDYWSTVPGGTGVARRLAEQRGAILATLAEQGSAAPGGVAEGAEDAPSVPPPGAPGLPPALSGAPGPEDIALYAYPAWSAAFVAAVARQAGVPLSDLPAAATHARYIDAVLLRAAEAPGTAPFLPRAPEEFAPRPGDLLCADRAARPLPHWSLRLGEMGQFRPMHCDVVVRTGPGVVEAVGGNVQDLVVLRRLPSDAAGRVLPAPPGQPAFVLILAARDQG
jgi:hypothetical protein